MRVCNAPGCPTLVPADTRGGRCPEHQRQAEQARGTRQQRGYDARHDRLRATYQQRMDAGERFTCWRCESLGKPHSIDPNTWDLGHDDHDRTAYRGPECRSGNRATAARKTSWDA